MISGVILIDKPAGWRSRQAVDTIGKALGIRKVGHAGTLDPAATGLMVVLLNEGTKLSQYLMDGDKTYRATICLGIETNSYDADGEIVAQKPTEHLSVEQVRQALQLFRGTIMQTPPAIAAVKIDGKPAYKYARAGQHVQLKPRPVTIYSLQVLRVELPEIELEIHCSKGTYIRAIAHDLGQTLGVGGHLRQIRRTASAPFFVRDAIDLNVFLKKTPQEQRDFIISLDQALSAIPRIEAGDDLTRSVANGLAIRGEQIYGRVPANMQKGDIVQIVTPQRIALCELTRPLAELGPPPWTGQQPLRYQRILHRH